MAISATKKRYNVSLTPEVVDRFQTLARDLRLNISISEATEDSLKKLSGVFQQFKDKGTLSLPDLFAMIGQETEMLFSEEGGKSNVSEKREEKKPSRKSTRKP